MIWSVCVFRVYLHEVDTACGMSFVRGLVYLTVERHRDNIHNYSK